MEQKKFSNLQVQSLKNVRKLIEPSLQKVNKIDRQIQELSATKAQLMAEIDACNMGVRNIFGYDSQELVAKGMRTIQRNGKDVLVPEYHLIYPDTIIPVEEHNDVSLDTTPIGMIPMGNENEGQDNNGAFGSEMHGGTCEESKENTAGEELPVAPEGETQIHDEIFDNENIWN